MKASHSFLLVACLSLAAACTDLGSVEKSLDDLESRMDAIEQAVSSANTNAASIRKILSAKTIITSYSATSDGYTLGLSDGTEIKVIFGTEDNCIVPIVGVDDSGYWIMSVDGGQTFSRIKGAVNVYETYGGTPQMSVDADGFWTYSLDGGESWQRVTGEDGLPFSARDGRAVSGTYSFFSLVTYNEKTSEMDFVLRTGSTFSVPVVTGFGLDVTGFADSLQTICLGETLAFDAQLRSVSECFFETPDGWRARLTDSEVLFSAPETGQSGKFEIVLTCTSDKGLLRRQKFAFDFKAVRIDSTDCKPWNDYLAGNEDNVLLDFSYAGYKKGEVAPPDVYSLGYKVYNVCDYGAVPNDGLSDRTAFLDCLQDAFKVKASKTDKGIQFDENRSAKAIVYFPEGDFILHSEEDNNEDSTSNTILIRSGEWVLKGAGRGKTRLHMDAPGFPGEPTATDKPWSGIPMITVTCWNGPAEFSTPVRITGNVKKGEFTVKVNSTVGVAKDSWVVIQATITDDEYKERCLQPYGSVDMKPTDIWTAGVKYMDYHQVKAVGDGEITFYEPVMYEIDATREFCVKNYVHYENVGFEDFTFVGRCPKNYLHHQNYIMDSGYVMLWLRRLVNSWIRRVDCESVTEGCSFEACANCSAYDMVCYGDRGHALVRSASSSRIFIGATYDHSDGTVNDSSNPVYTPRTELEGAGQLHGQGVNGFCVGSVIWRNIWGQDACFESHAQQPRASLFDCCKGGWMTYRVGGMYTSTPSHLDDLIIWNMNSTTAHGRFPWWYTGTAAWKVMPPTVVGFHGAACDFVTDQMKMNYSQGTAVLPESLYEAQMRQRLGYVPAWLNSIKTLYPTQ